jgi:hypothetical protein
MRDIEEKLAELENSIRLFNNANEILFLLLTTDERGQTMYNSLIKIESRVKELNDGLLLNLYNQIFDSFRTSNPYQQIRPDDYFAFLRRLGVLLNEATIQANKVDIALRRAVGLQSVIGIWGGEDLCPAG